MSNFKFKVGDTVCCIGYSNNIVSEKDMRNLGAGHENGKKFVVSVVKKGTSTGRNVYFPSTGSRGVFENGLSLFPQDVMNLENISEKDLFLKKSKKGEKNEIN